LNWRQCPAAVSNGGYRAYCRFKRRLQGLLPFQTAVTGLAAVSNGGRSMPPVETVVRSYFLQSLKRIFIFEKSSKIKYKNFIKSRKIIKYFIFSLATCTK
jgi:hypothetical protein